MVPEGEVSWGDCEDTEQQYCCCFVYPEDLEDDGESMMLELAELDGPEPWPTHYLLTGSGLQRCGGQPTVSIPIGEDEDFPWPDWLQRPDA